tara:strand:- start:185 stop:436 length:252 start_codon:yes stop_codon:yes gene_type:complete
MKTLIVATFAAIMVFAIEMAVPKPSVAGITCSTDFYGNTRCVDSGSGAWSNTQTDFYGNDNTTFSNGSTMSCRYDFYGNYVCN